MFFFFFFQAEDGIRDLIVTGVQTCALPIWAAGRREIRRARLVPVHADRADGVVEEPALLGPAPRERARVLRGFRSGLRVGGERGPRDGAGDRGRGGGGQSGRLQELAAIDGIGHALLLVGRSAETIGDERWQNQSRWPYYSAWRASWGTSRGLRYR